MNNNNRVATERAERNWFSVESCRLADLEHLASRVVEPDSYPYATRIEEDQVPVYDCRSLRHALAYGARREIMAEWVAVLKDGPGIVVLQGAFEDAETVDRATAVFDEIIADQHRAGSQGADHFAKAGANDRIWNALQKLCIADPAVFAAYYANDMIALISEAWLGEGYQVTSQVNVVNPGGAAQTPHRDYHLGFQTADVVARYPAHVHLFSPMLTLQGAVAHCDMPLESGPTLYMPFTQLYPAGYLAAQSADIRTWFMEHCTQLPLAKGDAVFFNPALLHAAGHNRSISIRRCANLLQVSSPYGRAMESVDRIAMAEAVYPVLLDLLKTGRMQRDDIDRVIAASAEGYAFPTNLDRDPPVSGLAPQSQQDLMRQALQAGRDEAGFAGMLADRQAVRAA
ncbi:hypothetical protein AA103196_1925 [Ameyamaea chiangmaiensis NBRC 103196]|uniref:Phytanoyl-CoA dioxygenase family protein n=1 Tax=Ameyamaea chiangmaiensis TaxID=442969 RepID=A0A850P5T2_9PROT|nr:phytanoyl-CoA dioxygenase family protein [Ameyamaea chiangmaiensis]MBS4073810.1 phytanoyl-CoA dioxygenase family protein [Ameyamaea chiangmaiensis]NVN39194.1 phytanoyl-CoA dioxygenase family protein [Ameyamaea chiangmaiensis]GBQ68345.1 hypothetical protein AA103196_1925 [Ameyamaea chiangmaiensis NBRC 103196]